MKKDDLDFVHKFVPGTSADAPVLLLLHGTGGSESDLLPLGREIAPEAALLSPRGKVLERGMPRFFRRLAEGVFDEEDLKQRTQELADFVVAAADTYAFERKRIVAVGYSNGANIAASMLLLRPETLAGAVLLRPMVPLVPDVLPRLADVPVLIAAGKADAMIPPPQTERLAALLQTAGARVVTHWSGGGHGLAQGDVDTAKEWLRKAFARGVRPASESGA